ncbi:MAG: hypothetical protein K6G24_00800 [Lachnospiraceae bacterium]|nr:hypothetical protein [Lachnospiraceae bacterium]
MDHDWIFKDIDELVTPVGAFRVLDGGRRVPFSVVKNPFDYPSEVYDKARNVIGTITSDTNYRIVIPISRLEIGKDYMVRFSAGEWRSNCSGEHTTCACTVIGDWVVGIGAYDWNDDEKEEQCWKYSAQKGYLDKGFVKEPPEYDESDFAKYSVFVMDDYNGYLIRLYDKTEKYVYIEVAWVKIERYSADEYEGALGVWLC